MIPSVINFNDKFSKIDQFYQPKVIAQLNDYHFKIAKLEGAFIWHSHPETDEAFIIIDGELDIEFRSGVATLKKGEMFVIPKGVEHKPVAHTVCHLLMIEPAGTLNTGDVESDSTVSDPEWI